MPTYEVRFYKGDYTARQQQANRDNCIAYVEHHFNSTASPTANYTVVVTGSNASDTSKNWGRWYAQEVAKKFGLKIGGTQGLLMGGYNGRGDENVKYTKMPAILLEPLFVSNPQGSNVVRSETGRLDLAMILVKSIRQFFPNGGIVGFSVGHKYKTTKPKDLGAQVYGGGSEAEFAELVLLKAKELLEAPTLIDKIEQQQQVQPAAQTVCEIRVVQEGDVVWRYVLGDKEELNWNADSRELKLKLIRDEDDDMMVENGILTLTVV